MEPSIPHAEQIKALPFFNDAECGGGISKIEQLPGGQQNSNYKVLTSMGHIYVCRVPGIDAAEHGQTHAIVWHNVCAAHTMLGVAPRPCYFDSSSGIIVTEYVDGEVLTIAAIRKHPEVLSMVVATIHQAHNALDSDKAFTPSVASDILFGYDLALLTGWCNEEDIAAAKRLQALLQRSLGCFDPLVSCHNDLVPANLLLDTTANGRVFIIDWEWAGPGDRLCDLSTFIALSEQDDEGEARVLAEYLGVSDSSATSALDRARLRLWRVWLDLRSALWARQKARSPYFAGRDASTISPDDDYNAFAEEYIGRYAKLINQPSTAAHVDVLAKAVAAAALPKPK